jgi:hypothetical protein
MDVPVSRHVQTLHPLPVGLTIYRYDDPGALIESLPEKVIGPADAKARELRGAAR